ALHQGVCRLTTAGPPAGGAARRSQAPTSWRAVLLLAVFLLLAPPMFVFGPLAGLLLLSRPSTTREWVWLAGVALWSVLWLQQTGGLGSQFIRAGAALLCGTFLALTLWRPSNRFSRALTATAAAGVALAVWMRHLGTGWNDVRQAVETELTSYHRAVRAEWATAPESRALLEQMSAMTDTVSTLYPALLALAAIAGLRLAWAWYHRIAEHPVGSPPAPFPAFVFSDQLVWGWVAGLAGFLLPVPEPWRLAGANLLLIWAVLYATRGLAVFSAGASKVPRSVIAALVLVSLFLLPFVLGGLTLLGLADTWLDFRRRFAAPNTRGLNP
nr:DUF2232 domain-containing protein [Gemmatimonadales bacterium]